MEVNRVSALSIAEIGEIEKMEKVVLAENGAAQPRYSTQATLSQEAERGDFSSLDRPRRPPRLDSQAKLHAVQPWLAQTAFASNCHVDTCSNRRLQMTANMSSRRVYWCDCILPGTRFWKYLELDTLQLIPLWLVLTVLDHRID
jgi:hypothetical protein